MVMMSWETMMLQCLGVWAWPSLVFPVSINAGPGLNTVYIPIVNLSIAWDLRLEY